MNRPDSMPMVSVVIPVYKDPWRLLSTLRSLARQTYPRKRFEIIVVDNGSNDDFIPCLSRIDNVVIAQESKAGAFPARNKGVSIACGKIVAFTDSDCIPKEDWIEMGVKPFLAFPDCVAAAGQIELFYKVPGFPSSLELYDKLTSLSQKEFVEKENYGATANLFVLKSFLDKFGSFDASFKTEGGDAELGHKIFESGMKLIFNPEAIVEHPTRRRLRDVIKKSLRATIGTQTTIERYNYSQRKFFQYIRYQIIERPLHLNRKMIAEHPEACFLTRAKVVLLYFFIKILQIFERFRIKIGGEPLR